MMIIYGFLSVNIRKNGVSVPSNAILSVYDILETGNILPLSVFKPSFKSENGVITLKSLLFDFIFVILNHLLDHLAADRTGLS